MRKMLIAVTLSLMVSLLANFVFAGIEEGLTAYKRGDYQMAFEEFKKLAEKEDAWAQYYLGAMYIQGSGIAKDETEAAKWFRKAADQGLAGAQNDLGAMYARGLGTARDEAEAIRWYRRAAEQGHPMAQNSLGFMYLFGQGCTKDEAEAVQWFRKAADQGDPVGQYHMGNVYATGTGVVKNEDEAVKWYKKAANQGYVRARQKLETMYRKESHDTGKPRIITDRYGASVNKRVEGSLESTRGIGCIPLSKVQNKSTPPDLYRGLVECLDQGSYDLAAGLSALADIYTRFDVARITDKSGQPDAVMRQNYFGGVSEERKAHFVGSIVRVATDPKLLENLCRDIRR